MTPQTLHIREPRYGWVMVVLAGLYMGLGSGSLGTIAVFLKPLVAEFGSARGSVTVAYLAGSIAMGAGSIGMGYLADRFSARPVAMAGATFVGASFLLLSLQQSLWQFLGLCILMGGLGASAFDAPLLANVGNWFERNKGLAIGLATAVRALGQGLVPFAAALLISLQGWRGAYQTLGVSVLVLALPLTLLIRHAPAALRPAPGAGGGAIVPPGISRRGIVLLLCAAALFCCIPMATALVHVAALAQDRGISAQEASTILLILFLFGAIGRVAFGRVADRIGGLRAYLTASVAQTALVFWFTQLDTALGFYLLAAAFGFGFSGVMTTLVVCVREFVPIQRRGVTQGAVLFLAWIGMGLGGWIGGFGFDLTGSYVLPFALAVLSGLLNLALQGVLLVAVSRSRPPDVLVPALRAA